MAKIHPPPPLPDDFSTDDFWRLPPQLPDAGQRLSRLEAAVRDDLQVLSYPDRTWDYRRSADILEVAIIGGGHTGKSAAFGLRRHGIENVCIFDRQPKGIEGPWHTFARNATLRTPKIVTGGLDWGIANLNFRRWCGACYGDDYWQRIHYIPRLLWAQYLSWYGQVLNLPIQNQTEVRSVTWNEAEQCFWLEAHRQGQAERYKARFVIFATGMECAGGRNIPAIVQAQLPVHCYHHTMDHLNFRDFAQQRVMIVGGGASAFDHAILLLRAGAKSVDIAIRRKQLPNLNRIRWSEWNGYHRHFIDLPDARKWAYSLSEFRLGQLPPPHTYYQAMSHPNLTLYTDAPVKKLAYVSQNDGQGGEIVGQYGDRTLRHDALICATGFVTDISRQPELGQLEPHIARWQDRFMPPPGDEHNELAQYPYLGHHLEFTPRSPEYDYLRRCYYLSSGAALLSGFRANLTGLQFALPRVAYDVGRQLFVEHQDEIWSAFNSYDKREF
ncbi:MAG: NAD(P)/FAD-dependent oxidoreductase [Cyanobacteria bacterium J06648_16]